MGVKLFKLDGIVFLCLFMGLILSAIGFYFLWYLYLLLEECPFEHGVALLLLYVFTAIVIMSFIIATVMFYLCRKRIKSKNHSSL